MSNLARRAAVSPQSVDRDYRTSAFGALRVAPPYTLADIENQYDINTQIWGTDTVGSATVAHEALTSSIGLSTTAADGDFAILQSHDHYRYQAGKGLRFVQTLFMSALPGANQHARWGLFDDDDGLFWRLNNGTLSFVVRSSVSGSVVETAHDLTTSINRAGMPYALDFTKGNIFEARFQWLGVGSVYLFINGINVHTIRHANTIAGPYMRTAQLPLRYELENDGAGAVNTLHAICATVEAEGGDAPPEIGFATEAILVAGTTEVPQISLRPAATINSIDNHTLLYPTFFAPQCTFDGVFRVYLNISTLTGAAFAAYSANSGAEIDVAATAFTLGTGILLGGAYVNAGATAYFVLDQIFNTGGRGLHRRFPSGQDTLTITVQKLSAATATFRTTLGWREVR